MRGDSFSPTKHPDALTLGEIAVGKLYVCVAHDPHRDKSTRDLVMIDSIGPSFLWMTRKGLPEQRSIMDMSLVPYRGMLHIKDGFWNPWHRFESLHIEPIDDQEGDQEESS